jgi:uncharacterized membrane protein
MLVFSQVFAQEVRIMSAVYRRLATSQQEVTWVTKELVVLLMHVRDKRRLDFALETLLFNAVLMQLMLH